MTESQYTTTALIPVQLNKIVRDSYSLDENSTLDDYYIILDKCKSLEVPIDLAYLHDAVLTHIYWIRECLFKQKNHQKTYATKIPMKEKRVPSHQDIVHHDTKKPVYIYVIQCDHTRQMKIGMTKDVLKRLSVLQTATPARLQIVYAWKVNEAYTIEQKLHQCFANQRLTGEWFLLSLEDEADLIAFMSEYEKITL